MSGAGSRQRAYLDHNATSPLRPQARAALLEALEEGGNAASVHAEGRAARARLERARREVAALAQADPAGVVFVSGASEASALALHPRFDRAGRPVVCDVLLASAVEHPCVLKGHRFADDQLEILPVDREGVLDLEALEARLAAHARAGRRAMLALMAANNETGVRQPVAEAARLVHGRDGVVVCDAVQLAGRAELDIAALGADVLFISAHKMGGPTGAGALVCAHPDTRPCVPLIGGGGQERGRRGGTHNVPGIAGFAAAATAARAQLSAEPLRLKSLRDRLEREIVECFHGARVAGAGADRLPNTACVMFPGLKAETLVVALDLAHISVSAGSACSSGKVGVSHVLTAMGLGPDEAGSAIRFSLGWSSAQTDVDQALAALGRVAPRMSSRPARVA